MYTAIPPCLACGIKPSLAHVLKAAISSVSDRQNSPAPSLVPSQPLLESHRQNDGSSSAQNNEFSEIITGPPIPGEEFQCSRCTFRNHPQLLACEICGAPLLSNGNPRKNKFGNYINRPESPGPTLDTTDSKFENSYDCIKISFRAGGDKIFHERLKGAMVQRKWLLQQAPPIPRLNHSSNGLSVNKPFASQNDSNFPPERQKVVGIAGLERRGEDQRKNNEFMIGSAFEDLEALMASAKQIVALAETFAKSTTDGSSDANTLLLESATALGMVTTKDMLKSNGGSDSLYLSELSRNLAEYLTDDARGILKKEGGIMSLVDLWAVYNRARGGIDLTSPLEFEKAARLWEKLKLPVRLRQFKSGLLVVQRHDWTDDKTIAQLLAWFQEMHETPPPNDVSWDWAAFGRGVTSQETARRFGWSVGVASEELEMAEEKGVLCREEGVEGLRFWENHILDENTPVFDQESRSNKDEEEILKNLKELGLGSW